MLLNKIFGMLDMRGKLIQTQIADALKLNISIEEINSYLLFDTITNYAALHMPKIFVKKLAAASMVNSTQYRASLNTNNGGIILSVPHYGPFLWACIGAGEIMREGRSLRIFFQDPEVNKGNKIINDTLSRFFTEEEICFDDRKGLAKAARALQQGGLCIIMPDALRSHENSFLVPFLNGEFEVQPGVATLTRLTKSNIVAAYVTKIRGWKYSIETETIFPITSDEFSALEKDYLVMQDILGAFSNYLHKEPIGWRFWMTYQSRVLYKNETLESITDSNLLMEIRKLIKIC